MNREKLVAELDAYYEENGITPDENFSCRNKEKCGINSKDFASGMQCHVGKLYGENCPKVLVVSLDCGGDGAETIENRVKSIEEVADRTPNLHMKGTIITIGNFLKMDKKDCLDHYAMTNSCKCCRSNSTSQLPISFYKNCVEYKLKEIEILNPDIIYYQGKHALKDVDFSDVENIPQHLSEYIKYTIINEKRYLSILCIHPSARFKYAKKRIEFYNDTIVEINSFIKESLLAK